MVLREGHTPTGGRGRVVGLDGPGGRPKRASSCGSSKVGLYRFLPHFPWAPFTHREPWEFPITLSHSYDCSGSSSREWHFHAVHACQAPACLVSLKQPFKAERKRAAAQEEEPDCGPGC